MPTEERSQPIDLENLGLTLSRPGDVIEEGHYVRLKNMTSRRTGFIETRGGTVKQNVTAIPAAPDVVHSLARQIVSDVGINYQGAGTEIFRDFVSISTGHSGSPVVFEDYKINNSPTSSMIAFEPDKRIKDDGSLTHRYGIAPGPVASAIEGVQQFKTIDEFESAASYTGVDATLSDDGTDPRQGTFSMKIEVAKLVRGTATKALVLDLGEFTTPGDSDDEDFIHFFLKIDIPKNLKEIRLLFDVDPSVNDFTQNYYTKSVAPNDFTRVFDFDATSQEGRDGGLREFALDESFLTEDDDIQQVDETTLESRSLESFNFLTAVGGENQWTEVFIKKRDFQRVGSEPTTFADVKAFRVVVEATECGDVNVNIDDGKMVGGLSFRLKGDYDWRYVYRYSVTGTISPLSPTASSETTVTRNRAEVFITFSTDPQVDFVDIYRRGGTIPGQYLFVDTIANGVGSDTFFDGLGDLLLGEEIDVNQIDVPSTSGVIAIHNNRAWLDDSANPDRLVFSRRIKVEEFESAGFIVASQGGDRVRRPFAYNDQLYCFTDRTIYRIVGSDERTFQPLATGASRGLFSRFALTLGGGVIFFRAYDGVYAFTGSGRAEKLTEKIDTLFEGFAVEGFEPIDPAESESERLGFFDNKLYFAYTDTSAVKQEMVYDFVTSRWEPTDRPATSYLLLDDLGEFQSGDSSGFVFQRETSNQDDGSDIVFDLRMKFLDFGAKQEEKNFTEIVVDADTAGQPVTVTAHFNNGETSVVLGTLNTATRDQIRFPVNGGIGTFARNCSIALTGDNGGVRMRFYKVIYNYWVEPREQLKTATDWQDYGNPKRKYLRELVIELDTQGVTADINVFCDGSSTQIGSPSKTFAGVSTVGRERRILSLPFDTDCKIARILVESTSATAPVKVYFHSFDWLDNSLESTTRMQTPWDEVGTPTEKFFVQFMLEIDTNSADVTVTPEVDGVDLTPFTVNTTSQQKVYLSFPKDTKGTLLRFKLETAAATEFIYYKHDVETLVEPRPLTGGAGGTGQTEWTSESWPGDKRLRQLILDIDTQGNAVTVNVEVDGVVTQSPVITTTGRQIEIISLDVDTIGKLVRLTFEGGPYSYYNHNFEFLRDPLDVTRWDTYELDFGYTRFKFIRRMWIASEGATIITLEIFVDEPGLATPDHTLTFLTNPASGWERELLRLPAGLKGQFFRFVFTSASPFKLWFDQSDVEWHPLAGERGYQRARLISGREAAA